MDWANIVSSILVALLFAIGLPMALRRRKKAGPQKLQEFFQYLPTIGVKASLVETAADQKRIGMKRGSGQRSEGIIEVRDRNIDYISVISVASQYGVNFYLDYLVRSPDYTGQKRKKTGMVKKKSSAIRGKVVDIEWRGDEYLSQELNMDYGLKDRLLLAEPEELKGNIEIFPEPQQEHARIRTAYLLPTHNFFDAIDIIARHVKSR